MELIKTESTLRRRKEESEIKKEADGYEDEDREDF